MTSSGDQGADGDEQARTCILEPTLPAQATAACLTLIFAVFASCIVVDAFAVAGVVVSPLSPSAGMFPRRVGGDGDGVSTGGCWYRAWWTLPEEPS